MEPHVEFEPQDIVTIIEQGSKLGERKRKATARSMGHDIRNPLTGVSSLSQMLVRQGDLYLTSAGQRQYVGGLETLSKRLANSARNLLDMMERGDTNGHLDGLAGIFTEGMGTLSSNLPVVDSVKDAGEPLTDEQERHLAMISHYTRDVIFYSNHLFAPQHRQDTFDLKNGLRRYVKERKRGMEDLGITLTHQINSLETHGDFFTRVVSHIIGNAVEYAYEGRTEGGRIRVTSSTEVRDGAQFYVLAVDDWGVGMSQQQLSYLFRERHMPEKLNGAMHGWGLQGAKEFTESRGGSIEVESIRGRGTRVKVYLPVVEGADGVYVHTLAAKGSQKIDVPFAQVS